MSALAPADELRAFLVGKVRSGSFYLLRGELRIQFRVAGRAVRPGKAITEEDVVHAFHAIDVAAARALHTRPLINPDVDLAHGHLHRGKDALQPSTAGGAGLGSFFGLGDSAGPRAFR